MKETKSASIKRYDPSETTRMVELQGAELASFKSRAVALVIDFSIAGALFLPAAIGVGKLVGSITKRDVNLELNFFHNWYSVVYLAIFFGLSNYFGNGKTLGKKVMGIRAVSIVHHHLGLWHSFERALGYGASTLEFGFGFLQYFFHPNRRTAHDRIAETIVIRDR